MRDRVTNPMGQCLKRSARLYSMRVMKPRTLHRWILWLLPLMLLRAFVPAGFMLAAHSGELSVVFCSSVRAPATSSNEREHPSGEPAATAHSHHYEQSPHQANSDAPTGEHQLHHGQQSDGSEHNASGANSCPYALIAATPAGQIEFFLGQPASEASPHRFTALPFSSFGPQRTESIRGPPAFI